MITLARFSSLLVFTAIAIVCSGAFPSVSGVFRGAAFAQSIEERVGVSPVLAEPTSDLAGESSSGASWYGGSASGEVSAPGGSFLSMGNSKHFVPLPLPDAIKERLDKESKNPQIRGATAHEAKAGEDVVVNLTLVGGEDKDRLIGVYSPWADHIELRLYSDVWQGEEMLRGEAQREDEVHVVSRPNTSDAHGDILNADADLLQEGAIFYPEGQRPFRTVDKISLDSHAVAVFGAGEKTGFSLLMRGIKREIAKSQFFPIVFVFEKAGPVSARVRVLRP